MLLGPRTPLLALKSLTAVFLSCVFLAGVPYPGPISARELLEWSVRLDFGLGSYLCVCLCFAALAFAGVVLWLFGALCLVVLGMGHTGTL